MHIENNKHKLFFVLSIIIFIFFGIVAKPTIHAIPFSYDEPDYVANSILLKYFTSSKPVSDIWTKRIAYDQPHLYHYLCGLYLQQKYHQPIDQILTSNTLVTDPENPYIEFNENGHGKTITDSYIQNLYKPYHLISSARTLSYYFFLITGIIFISIFYLIKLPFLGIIFSLLFLSDYIFSVSILAQSDGLLLMMISLTILMSLVYLNYPKKHLLTISLLAIICGLSISTKLNGFISTFSAFLCLDISYKKRKNMSIYLQDFIFLVSIAFLTFVILNPYFYSNTFENINQMFNFRFYEGYTSILNRPQESFSHNIIIKLIQFSQNLYTFLGLSTTKSFTLTLFSLLSSVYILFLYFLNKIKITHLQLFVLLNSLLIFFLVFYYIPMNWARYYLPALIANIFIVLLNCNFIFDIFSRKIVPKNKLF